mgnify:CR=1 FL=1
MAHITMSLAQHHLLTHAIADDQIITTTTIVLLWYSILFGHSLSRRSALCSAGCLACHSTIVVPKSNGRQSFPPISRFKREERQSQESFFRIQPIRNLCQKLNQSRAEENPCFSQVPRLSSNSSQDDRPWPTHPIPIELLGRTTMIYPMSLL